MSRLTYVYIVDKFAVDIKKSYLEILVTDHGNLLPARRIYPFFDQRVRVADDYVSGYSTQFYKTLVLARGYSSLGVDDIIKSTRHELYKKIRGVYFSLETEEKMIFLLEVLGAVGVDFV